MPPLSKGHVTNSFTAHAGLGRASFKGQQIHAGHPSSDNGGSLVRDVLGAGDRQQWQLSKRSYRSVSGEKQDFDEGSLRREYSFGDVQRACGIEQKMCVYTHVCIYVCVCMRVCEEDRVAGEGSLRLCLTETEGQSMPKKHFRVFSRDQMLSCQLFLRQAMIAVCSDKKFGIQRSSVRCRRQRRNLWLKLD